MFWFLLAGDASGCLQERIPILLTEFFSSFNTGTKILVIRDHGFLQKRFGH
jgi:hypothetical protein